jgi:tRNA U34 5-methylaminomethyl-2-thiouridine-forming methyltransferase MnmC
MSNYQPQITADGSLTFFAPDWGETYHSQQGALEEAELKFILPLQLAAKAHQPKLCLLDICYGLGYNTGAALAAIWRINPHCLIELIGLELDQNIPQFAIKTGLELGTNARHILNIWQEPIPEILQNIADHFYCRNSRINAQLLIGDARQTIQDVINSNFRADAILFDPFSPPICPQLWSIEFLNLVAQCLKPTGRLATYSCAAAVRIALLEAGLKIGATTPVGRKSPGTIASFDGQDLPPISQQEKEHLFTRAAIPYRDPNLSDTAAIILQRRELEQTKSILEPTSQWRKRFSAKD